MTTETKLALAKLLPEHFLVEGGWVYWRGNTPLDVRRGCVVMSNEWLWVCHEIENGLSDGEWLAYVSELKEITDAEVKMLTGMINFRTRRVISATAEQRAEALLTILK